MKNIREIAVILKEEFNKKGKNYTGLCIALNFLDSKITDEEFDKFYNFLNNETLKRKTGYVLDIDGYNHEKIKISKDNYHTIFIWKPYNKIYRNTFLNKLINS